MPVASERRLRFTADFRWSPPERKGRSTILFRAGRVYFVRLVCAKAALAAKVAVPVRKGEA